MSQQVRDIIIGVSCLLIAGSTLPGWFPFTSGIMLLSRPTFTLFAVIPITIVGLLSLAAVLDISLPPAIKPIALMRPALARGVAVIALLAVIWPVNARRPGGIFVDSNYSTLWSNLSDNVESAFRFVDPNRWHYIAFLATIVLIVTAMADPRWSVADGAEARRWQHSSR